MSTIAVLAVLAGFAQAQFPSPPTDLTVITSTLNPNVTISYKQTDLCETTPGVKTFSGFVHLPQSALYDMEFDFPINTYFLFFEARNNPGNAPLGIYLAGGPGESSAFTAMDGEGGPCYVNLDGNSTTLNPWSFNNYANMLYIDQPVGAGFSYTKLINGTHDALTGVITPLNKYAGEVPPNNGTFGQGTYTDPTPWSTTNTSISSAQALWHFAEHWLTQFPEYKSNNKNIAIWGNSAGGAWAPATGALFHKKFQNASEESPLGEWSIDNVGVTNGEIDLGYFLPYYLDYAHSNTYGRFLDDDVYAQAKENYTREGGCRDLVDLCHAASNEGDALGRGTNETVNQACKAATGACMATISIFQTYNNVTTFDIAVKTNEELGGDPCPYYLPVNTFLNQAWTQKSLGVPLNFTYISNTVLSSYSLLPDGESGTGDFARTDRRYLEYLLQNDIKVSLVYGDRDTRCPWNAGEGLALDANYTGHDGFNRAGYEFIATNDTYKGGAVKQYGTFSFSRVFQSGHSVNAYQPETVARIFDRTLRGTDVATGQKNVSAGYATQGPRSSFYMVNETLPETPGTCMVLGNWQSENVLVALLQSQGRVNSTGSSGGAGSGGGNGTVQSNGVVVVKLQRLQGLLAALAVLALFA